VTSWTGRTPEGDAIEQHQEVIADEGPWRPRGLRGPLTSTRRRCGTRAAVGFDDDDTADLQLSMGANAEVMTARDHPGDALPETELVTATSDTRPTQQRLPRMNGDGSYWTRAWRCSLSQGYPPPQWMTSPKARGRQQAGALPALSR